VLNPAHLERHKTYILCTELGSSAGLLGACLLPLQEKIAPRVSEDLLVH
jgi:glucokinase